MKIAVTSTSKEQISGKADDCLNYWIYTIENKEITNKKYLKLGEGQNLYNIFFERAVEIFVHPIFEADMLLTNDISALVTSCLREKRTVAFIIDEKNADIAIEQVIKGTLQGSIAEEDVKLEHKH